MVKIVGAMYDLTMGMCAGQEETATPVTTSRKFGTPAPGSFATSSSSVRSSWRSRPPVCGVDLERDGLETPF